MFLVKINETLQNDILSSIPADYSKLEKAIFIYRELCKKLEYSMDFFLDRDKTLQYFITTKNIEKVDGIHNKDVVCFTFNVIFIELLYAAKLCDTETFTGFYPFSYSEDVLDFMHKPVYVAVDGYSYLVDATFGIIDNNDLTLSKYSTHKLQGWRTADYSPTTLLNSAIEKVCKDDIELNKSINEYVKLKKDNGNYINLPLKDRVKMFLDMSVSGPEYSILSFNYMIKLKHLLFTNEELNPLYHYNVKLDIEFVKDIKTGTYKALVLFNPKGYTDEYGLENFNELSITEIDIKSRTLKPLDLESLREKIESKEYVKRTNESIDDIEMTKVGIQETDDYGKLSYSDRIRLEFKRAREKNIKKNEEPAQKGE